MGGGVVWKCRRRSCEIIAAVDAVSDRRYRPRYQFFHSFSRQWTVAAKIAGPQQMTSCPENVGDSLSQAHGFAQRNEPFIGSDAIEHRSHTYPDKVWRAHWQSLLQKLDGRLSLLKTNEYLAE